MIEKTVIGYLSDALDVPVAAQVPDDEGIKKFVLVEKTGGSTDNYIQSATLAIQSYGATLLEAAELSHAVKGMMADIDTLDSVSGIEINNEYNYTDAATKRYRYQLVARIWFYD